MNNRDMKKLPIFNYHITNQGGERLDVYIEGTIVDAESQEMMREWFGDETSVSFKSFRTDILDSGLKNIRITINCFGGQIGETEAICAFITELENSGYSIEGKGLGFVCSSATKILSTIKNSKISKNSWYMIHNAAMYFGYMDVDTAERNTSILRKFNDNVRDFYVDLTKLETSQIQSWMSNETWFTGAEAVQHGFVKALIEDDYKDDYKPINQSDWQFKNQNPMNVYNSFVNKPIENTDDNFNPNIDMKKLVDAILNAFKANNLVVTEENKAPESLTTENLSNALNEAFKDIDIEPKAPTNEQVESAMANFFANGLPENILSQITNAVKPTEQTPFNLKEDEGFKAFEKRVEEVENKILNGVGASQPPKNEDASKYEGVSFS